MTLTDKEVIKYRFIIVFLFLFIFLFPNPFESGFVHDQFRYIQGVVLFVIICVCSFFIVFDW